MLEVGTGSTAVQKRMVISLLGKALEGKVVGEKDKYTRKKGEHCLGHSLWFFLSSPFVSCQELNFQNKNKNKNLSNIVLKI